MAADWSLLPSNLVDSVAVLLNAADQARMAAVCKPWRQAMAEGFCREQRKPSIWIALSFSRRRNEDIICVFRGFSEDVKRKYGFPIPANVRVRGSSQGWLMLEDAATCVHAYNPLTKETLSFPAVRRPNQQKRGAVVKAVIVQREGLPLMAVILRRVTGGWHSVMEIATAEIGDDSWTTLSQDFVTDIAVRQETLYAINFVGGVFVHDLRRKKLTLSPAMHFLRELMYDPHLRSHLGLIAGKPVILRFWTSGDWSTFSPHCQVFALDTSGPVLKWERTTDLAGHAVLLGHDGMMALRPGECEKLQANCVYFLGRGKFLHQSFLVQMNVKTKAFTFELIFHDHDHQPSWFLPNPGQL